MMELAKGLEDSGKSFIWVVRPPIGFDPKGEFKAEWLPDGFEERMVERKQGWPLAAEQAYNAKIMVEETGVCVKITRRGIETSVQREEVKRVIDLVMDENREKDKR
ncbi:hypothetical protein ACSBR2_039194 [Camellia fascicularis]